MFPFTEPNGTAETEFFRTMTTNQPSWLPIAPFKKYDYEIAFQEAGVNLGCCSSDDIENKPGWPHDNECRDWWVRIEKLEFGPLTGMRALMDGTIGMFEFVNPSYPPCERASANVEPLVYHFVRLSEMLLSTIHRFFHALLSDNRLELFPNRSQPVTRPRPLHDPRTTAPRFQKTRTEVVQ